MPPSDSLLVAVVLQACALAIGAAAVVFWIRRRLDAADKRDSLAGRRLSAIEEQGARLMRGLKRVGRKVGARMVLYDQSVFDEDDLSESDRDRLSEHLRQTRAGTPDEREELRRRATRTPAEPLPALVPAPPATSTDPPPTDPSPTPSTDPPPEKP